jgi:hypothetical protein
MLNVDRVLDQCLRLASTIVCSDQRRHETVAAKVKEATMLVKLVEVEGARVCRGLYERWLHEDEHHLQGVQAIEGINAHLLCLPVPLALPCLLSRESAGILEP